MERKLLSGLINAGTIVVICAASLTRPDALVGQTFQISPPRPMRAQALTDSGLREMRLLLALPQSAAGGDSADMQQLDAWRSSVVAMRVGVDTLGKLLRAATLHPVQFKAWAAQDTGPALHIAGPGSISAGEVTLRGLISQSPVEASVALGAIRDETTRRKAAAYVDTLRGLVSAALSPLSQVTRVDVLAEGNIRAIATGNAARGTNANGSLAMRVSRENLGITAAVNIASTADTLAGDYAQLILGPATGRFLRAGLFDVRWRPNGRATGAHAYLTASQGLWKNADTSPSDTVTVVGASVWGAGVLLFWDVLADKIGDTPVGLSVEAGGSIRYLGGDISQEDAFRQRPTVLGSERTLFGGIELGLQVRFSSIVGALQAYWYPGEAVRGVTHMQLVGGFAVQAPILSGVLGKK